MNAREQRLCFTIKQVKIAEAFSALTKREVLKFLKERFGALSATGAIVLHSEVAFDGDRWGWVIRIPEREIFQKVIRKEEGRVAICEAFMITSGFPVIEWRYEEVFPEKDYITELVEFAKHENTKGTE